jgi:hypothetical protein
MNYTEKIYRTLTARLTKVSYPQGDAASANVPFPSNPDVPSSSQQSRLYDRGSDSKFCTKCNSKNIKKHGDGFICGDCNTRFSDSHFEVGEFPGSRQPGLLNLDSYGNKSEYHMGDPRPTSTFSQSTGRN